MNLKELQKWIINNLFINEKLVPKRVSLKSKWIKENPEIYNLIVSYTNFLPDNCILNRRIFHIINEIFYLPTCLLCNNFVKYKSYNKGYSFYCSQKCVNKMRKEKFKKKYSVNSPLQNKEMLQKSKNTKKEKYGSESFNNREKCEKTCLDKYGVKNPQLNKKV